ncbi:sensor domain-containing diguanylate cyclase [Alteromonas sp. C1M14]|uniref:GGDEF domain-containing protein n=1 Tax=Alteromonas sp. C1M14 TaxID=2841567 RepID=UPI001C0A18CD|nr:sensor domain-containing diguanylate cyclase [Alteromonas sp. C1M14]MBU2977438.1 diguanylate cyclase [Alteromonas sp. C1M14]
MFKLSATKILHRGCDPKFDEETNRRILVMNLFSLVGFSITLILGLSAMAAAAWLLGASLLVASFLFMLSGQIQAHYRNKYGQVIAIYVLTSCLMMLETFLIVTGGVNNTGPLWIYILPPVAMFFGGFKRGIIIMTCFTLLIAIILLFPNDALLFTEYDHAFKTRLIYSFITVSFLSAFYEYSRQRTYKMMRTISEQFEQQALHDPLTNLPNRRGINQLLVHELKRHQRSGKPMTLVIADVDHFKQINDTYGHAHGDIVLERTSSLLRQNIRQQDMVSRWGGEEFLIILPETTESDGVYLANKLRVTLSKTSFWLNDVEVTITASFGVCEINENVSLDQALTLADNALYEAKHLGRNTVVSKQ